MYVVLIKLLSLCFLSTNTLSLLCLRLCLYLCHRLRLRLSSTLTHIKFSYFSIYLFSLSPLLSRHRHFAFPIAFTMRSTSRTEQEVRAATGPAGRQPLPRAACSPDSGLQYMDVHRTARRGSSRNGIEPAPRRTDSLS